jgi:hypothetical protein
VLGQGFAICRAILLTSTLSSCLTANSKRCCGRLPRGLFRVSSGRFALSLHCSEMCQLFQTCRLCFRMTGVRFRFWVSLKVRWRHAAGFVLCDQ